jgi:hypothetical protein
MIRSFPPHPNPLPLGGEGIYECHFPQQSWGVFWHILIKGIKNIKIELLVITGSIKQE